MKKVRLLIVLTTVMLSAAVASAQEIVVTSFEMKVTDLTAKIDPVYDLNDEACALVKVSLPGKNVVFTGDIIKGPDQVLPGEYHIYIPKGTKRVKVAAENYAPLTFEFPMEIEEFRTYELKLKLVDRKKTVWALITPSLSWAPTHTSYGILVGVLGEKSGGFVHLKSDFNFLTVDGEATSQLFYSGNTQKSRLAVTGGYMMRVAKPVYLFAGAGYGSRILAWETDDGILKQYNDCSASGVEAELGAMFRFGAFCVGLSAQTTMFKFYDFNAFIGVMF